MRDKSVTRIYQSNLAAILVMGGPSKWVSGAASSSIFGPRGNTHRRSFIGLVVSWDNQFSVGADAFPKWEGNVEVGSNDSIMQARQGTFNQIGRRTCFGSSFGTLPQPSDVISELTNGQKCEL